MPTNLLKGKLLITTSLVGAIKQILTSSIRHRRQTSIKLTSRTLTVIALLNILSLTLTANGLSSGQKSREMKLLRNNKFDSAKQPMSMTSQCKNCEQLRHIRSLFDLIERPDETSHMTSSLLKAVAKSIYVGCGTMTYQRCKTLHLWNKEIRRKAFVAKLSDANELKNDLIVRQQTNKRTITTSSNNDVEASGIISKAESPYSPLTVLSRQKRKAVGDRRLLHLHCRTGYTLQIRKDGSVVGSLVRSPQAELEIQSVSAGGVVRFYSPTTGRYLAMSRRGRLYGANAYHHMNSAFVERVGENLWSTYYSLNYPKRKKGKRSAARAWYIGIGKHGFARKANRIRPQHTSAQFLPLYG